MILERSQLLADYKKLNDRSIALEIENKLLLEIAEAAKERLEVWTRETYVAVEEALTAWGKWKEEK